MREILFRGKRKDNGEWVYGSLVHIANYCAIIQHDQDSLSVFDQVYLDCELGTIDGMGTIVIPETVGQYTGLNDKNGKKIFEGDVVKCTFCYDVGQYPKYEINTRVVEFKIAGFYPFARCIHDPCEIIGNIHDNPELLEVK